MELTTETTRLEEIIISLLFIFIGIVIIALDIHCQITFVDGHYIPSILSLFGFGFLFLSYVFAKKP